MKRSIFGAAALALALSASTVQAQRPFSVGVALGATVPVSDLGDDFDTGYHGTVSVNFSPPALPVGVRIEGAFNQLAGTDGGIVEFNDYRILSVTANATLGIPMAMSPISPYLVGGLGLYRTSYECTGCQDPKSNDLGFNIGVGTKFGMAGFGAFVEARYHYVQGEEDSQGNGPGSVIRFIPISFGIMF